MKKIILCADDFALSAPISEGIVELVEMGRLSAVSCMTEGKYWRDKTNRLPQQRDRVDIGLHFNLTQGFGTPKVSLQTLIRESLLGSLSRHHIETSLHNQLDLFEAVMGEAPDFIDGHQHIHLFPRVRTVLLQTLARRYRHRRPWLRQVNPSLRAGTGRRKSLIIDLLGWGFAREAARYGFNLNPSFSGIYTLHNQTDFGSHMRQWLRHASDGELIMCHPGKLTANNDNTLYPSDTIATTRTSELAWLASDEFGALLRELEIKLVRFKDIAPPH